ncbi:hypothetical protein [Caulobacter sp.]|uniref:hypothetical protein n=1 Tax=Caulobacter sp. TaxID=78 RepID=UPI003BB1909B
MSEYDPVMDAALSGDRVTQVHLVEVALPGGTLRLNDSGVDVPWGVNWFKAVDFVYGALDGIEGLGDGVDAQVSEVELAFNPYSLEAAVTLGAVVNQGAAVQIWKAALDPATGTIAGAPKRRFAGELDVPVVETSESESGDTRLSLTWSVVAETDRLFDANEGIALSDAFMQRMWPGDLGCAFVTGVQDQNPWGLEARIPASVTAPPRTSIPRLGRF